MFRTPLAERLGIRYPIVQAPIGSASTAALAAAVSRAGGLGSVAASWRTRAELEQLIADFRAAGGSALLVNFVLEWDQRERIRAALDAGVRLISLAWGDPAPLVPEVHEAGAIVLHSVGSVAEARHAALAGADVIVAQGWEAGGHVLGTTASSILVPAVVDAVAPTPVIAAGGIADGRGIAAALAWGAEAAMLGTRFLVAAEAGVHPEYRSRVLGADDVATTHTLAFDGGWPNAPHRALENDTTRMWREWQEIGGPRPGAEDVVARRPDGTPVARYDDVIPGPGMTGDLVELALYAGQSAALVWDSLGAGATVARLAAEAETAFERLARLDRAGRRE
jgi:NAD(P)H-dependent flavin oxidoreductase YrpB (nitropropane dioxygenase family)